MDAERFDTLTRTLSAPSSRRRTVAALSGVLGLALDASSPQDAGAKKKPCPPCKKRKQGKCKKKLPDGTACHNGGTCLGGSCVAAATPPPPPPPCPSGCGAWELCRNNQCVACGDEDEPCCAGDPPCQGSIEDFTQKACHPVTQTCQLCAGRGGPCCPGNECYQPDLLVCMGGLCEDCGGAGELCCGAGSTAPCQSSSSCPSGGRCA